MANIIAIAPSVFPSGGPGTTVQVEAPPKPKQSLTSFADMVKGDVQSHPTAGVLCCLSHSLRQFHVSGQTRNIQHQYAPAHSPKRYQRLVR